MIQKPNQDEMVRFLYMLRFDSEEKVNELSMKVDI